MPKKPIMSKIRVENPNLKSSRLRNRNYLIYIGTRDGVDISDPLMELNAGASNDVYLKYIHERPKSHGLFGNMDVSDINELANHIANETRKGKCIYKGIISLSEEDAINLGYDDKANWMNLVNGIMPDIAKEFGIPISSLQYCAAVHMEQGHPHCHYMFWNEKDKVTSPYIHTSKQDKIREMISGVINEEEIKQHTMNKTLQRDLILDLNKNILEEELEDIFKINSKISGRIKNKDIDKIGKEIIKLANELPESGRILYKLMPTETKLKVDKLVDDILEVPTIKKEYQKYVSTVNEISKAYSASSNHQNYTEDKSVKDLKKRLANQVLKTCNKIRDIPLSINLDAEPGEEIINPEVNEEIDVSNIDIKDLWNREYKWAIKSLYDSNNNNIHNVIKILQKQAENGNVLAMHDLGKIYAKGIKIEKNPELAEKYYKAAFKGFSFLASDGNQYFNYRLGKMYEAGNGTEQNYEKAILCYKSASNNKYAQYSLASLYLRYKGINVTADNESVYYTEALNLLKRSAEQSNGFASYSLAKNSEKRNLLNLEKNDINKHYAKAAQEFKKNIKDVENDFLLYRLGTMYYDGKGLKEDKEKAFEYFKKSAEMNNANALYAIGKYYADKSMDIYNPVKAEENFLASIREGNEFAKYSLALLYIDSENTLYDIHKGVSILKEIANENISAIYQLGKIYATKDLGYYNMDKGIKLFIKAAELGNMNAKYQLGKIYTDKESGYYNIHKGIGYLKEAAKNENTYAMTKLGNIYLFGKHAPEIPKDINLGLEYLQKAVEKGNPYAQDMINFYENYKNAMIHSLSYSMLQNVCRTISEMGQSYQGEESLKKYARKSKEYKKVQAKINKHGQEI